MGATAAIAGGVLGGLGSAAGGILPSLLDSGNPPNILVGGGSPSTDPLLAAIAAQSLLPFGIVDPTILQRSSPLQRALADYVNSPQKAKRQRQTIVKINRVLEGLQSGLPLGLAVARATNEKTTRVVPAGEGEEGAYTIYRPAGARGQSQGHSIYLKNEDIPPEELARLEQDDPGIQEFLAYTGYGTLSDLFAADQQYQTQIEPLTAELQGLAGTTHAAQLHAIQQRANFINNLDGLDLSKLRQQEQALIDQRRSEETLQLLRSANAANFNPGTALRELERAKTEDPLTALTQALALQQGSLANQSLGLSLLDTAIGVPTDTAAKVAALRLGGQAGGVYTGAPSNNQAALAAGQGVAQGFNTIGQGIVNYYAQQNSNQQFQDLLAAFKGIGPGT